MMLEKSCEHTDIHIGSLTAVPKNGWVEEPCVRLFALLMDTDNAAANQRSMVTGQRHITAGGPAPS